jgi:hypothetical protein
MFKQIGRIGRSLPNFKNFNPIQIKINKNKKALLIGINYTGTKNELFGCINDVNAVKERITSQGFTSVNTITDLTTKKQTRSKYSSFLRFSSFDK